MLDHVFITVSDIDRSIAFYEKALAPLGIVHAVDYDGKDGPPGHPDLKGFGANGRVFFWLREGVVEGRAAHVGFVANGTRQVDAAHAAAMAAGATEIHPPGPQLHYDPRYYALRFATPTATASNSLTRNGSTDMKKLMIYGATGYTGRMAAEHAKAAGTPVVLAGRSEATLAKLASELGAECRVFALDDAAAIDQALADIAVILNCAGPFMRTADVLMRASIRNGTHYLDVAAELDSYRLAEVFDAEARAVGVMLLPGGGGSVAMLGSLAGHAVRRATNPRKIRIALHVAGGMSRGSVVSATENLAVETFQRVDGRLVSKAANDIQRFDFGKGGVDCFPVTLPDLMTIWKATNVPNIETFVHLTGDGFPQGDLSALPDGPTERERLANRYQAAVEVTDSEGHVTRSLLDTVNGYTFTAIAAAEAGRRVLAGEARPGFQTPAGLFGNGFAETIADTTIVDI